MKNFIFLILSLFLFSNCEKKEELLVTKERPNAKTITIDVEEDYRYQIWYNVVTDQQVKMVNKLSWDLAFSCDPNNSILKLNSANFVRAAITNYSSLNSINDGNRLVFNPDHQTGNTDSLALGDVNKLINKVIVIDRGYNTKGELIGLKKMLITNVNESSYTLSYANMDNSGLTNVTIKKNSDYNNIALSLNKKEAEIIEPKKNEFHLLFSQYTHVFYEPYNPYLVFGVLLNTHNTEVALIEDKPFEEVTINDIESLNFNKNKDAVGYNWKEYSFESSSFILFPEKVYILKINNELFYKLNFIDFYDLNGKKGNPTFTIKPL